MENLRFDKEGYFHVVVFYTGYFIKEIENIFFRAPIRYRNTRGSLGEREIAWKHSPYGSCSHTLVLPNFLVFLKHLWKQGKCFPFHK